MNYLAHAYLSFGEKELLFGNFIGDFVKGSTNTDFPEEIWRGVMLHRNIDSFTDQHPDTLAAKDLIREDLGLTSGIFIDMIFDHILALKWSEYSEDQLGDFTEKTYQSLDRFQDFFPEDFSYMYQYMRKDDWLKLYKEEVYMERFLAGVSRRLKVKNGLKGSFRFYKDHEIEMEQHFMLLFQDLIEFSSNY